MVKININDEIYLSPPQHTDAEQLLQLLQDPSVSENTFIPHPYTYKDAVEFLGRTIKINKEAASPLRMAIRRADGRLIGMIGAHPSTVPHLSHKVEVGYWLGSEYRGKGHMSSVLRAMVDYLFDQTGYVKIFAPIFTHNKASMRVAEKAGFKHEATLRKNYVKNGEHLDAELYSIFRGEE